ncbi:MAG: EAL domain-containing protein [Burkholderiaceae bacterium]|nr:EAL domain-containing protein [Burkholderiaceae bacterium]
MSANTIRLLLLDSNSIDAALLQAVLAEYAPGEFVTTHADRLSAALDLLDRKAFDIVLADLGLPDSSGLDAVRALATHAAALPVVVLTGTHDENELGRAAIQLGAQDFLAKAESGGALIARTLRHAIERKRMECAAERERTRLQTILMMASDGIHILDSDGVLVEANDAFLKMTGYDRTAIGTLRVTDWNRIDSWEVIQARVARLIAQRGKAAYEIRHYRSDGAALDVEITASYIELDGKSYICACSRDITERKSAEKKIQRLNNLYAALSHCNEAIVRCTDEQSLFSQVCHDATTYGGMKMAWIGVVDKHSELVAPVAAHGDGLEYLHGITISVDPANKFGDGPSSLAYRENRAVWTQDLQRDPVNDASRERAGLYGWGACAALPLRRNGAAIGIFKVYAGETNAFDEAARDLLERMAQDISFALDNFVHEAARRHGEAQRRLAADVFDQSTEGILIVDSTYKIVMVNYAFTVITGYGEDEVLGQNPSVLASGYQDPAFYRDMWDSIDTTGHWQGELWNRRKDGVVYPEWLAIRRVLDFDGKLLHYIGTFSDITQRKAAEEHIHWLAHYDSLTGLPNRVLLADRTAQSLSAVQRNNQSLALLFLDLDHFKNVNDSLGRHIGDALLTALAKRLAQELREQDTVSRLGVDEFILILPGIDAAGAARVAEKLSARVAQPFQIDLHELNMTASIGIAMYPGDGQNFDSLSKCADVALRRAKQDGRNAYRFFTREMQERSARRVLLENELRRALERGEFALHYQPQLSLEDNRIVGAEALLRWTHPTLGAVSPAEFIPITESSGLIMPIGEWVLRTAVRQWTQWLDGKMAPMTLAVNLSAAQFKHMHLAELVTQILDEEKLAPRYLELELTEGSAMDDPLAAIAVMDDLHRRGVRMSIDDFGTGYSSLGYLKRFKVNKLKIDQSFVRDITENYEDQAIVGAIISLANNLGMQTIAEGVETGEQMAFLRDKGCNELQGYYFSKPLAAEQFEALVRERNVDTA